MNYYNIWRWWKKKIMALFMCNSFVCGHFLPHLLKARIYFSLNLRCALANVLSAERLKLDILGLHCHWSVLWWWLRRLHTILICIGVGLHGLLSSTDFRHSLVIFHGSHEV
jgi:hypothetical protein